MSMQRETLNYLFFSTCACSYCLDSSLNRTKASGKVLVCRHAESSTDSKLEKSVIVKQAGGVGMILIDEADKDVAIPFVIPSAVVGRRIGNHILSYINRTRSVLQIGIWSFHCACSVFEFFRFPDLYYPVIVNSIPKSRIFPAKTVLGSQPAPRVTAFSSKGPNALTPEILKVNFQIS